MLLEGKTVVVTGGNSGIGAAVAERAAAEGAKVVIDYVTGAGDAHDLVARIRSTGASAMAVEADVSRVPDLTRLIDAAVDAYGRLDVLVSNAGIETRTSLLETTEDQYDRVMSVNLRSAFFGAQIAARRFIAQGGGGVIINMSSVHEDWPMPGNAAYCVAKGGMRMLSRTAGVELGRHGIRMVNVGPGAVATPINASTESDPAKLKRLKDSIPLGRLAEPVDIARLVVTVASDQASYLTATTIFADGGLMQSAGGL